MHGPPLNQMTGVLRNHFLHLACIGCALMLLAACTGKQPTGPPPAASPSRPILALMGHTIQVGAFAKAENAARLTARLLGKGLSAYYFRGEGGLYRVRFSNYPSYDAALASAKRFRQDELIDVFVVIRPQSYPAERYRGQEDLIRNQLVSVSQQFIGVPYQWGDAIPGQGFDCSGLAMMVYQLIGLDMPRISRDQFRRGRQIDRDQLRPGDLVFFSTGWSGKASHVGIYQGDGLFIHAPRSGKTVSRATLSSAYFQKHYLGARSYL